MDDEKLKKGLSPQKLDSYTRYLHCVSDRELIATYIVLRACKKCFIYLCS